MVPNPWTGGGGKTATNASLTPLNFAWSFLAMAAPLISGLRRSSNGFRVMNAMPALGLLMNPVDG